MLDALVPGVEALATSFDAAAEAAEQGALATVPMQARKGRASYLGERSIGHQDPGATSSALLFAALAEVAEVSAADDGVRPARGSVGVVLVSHSGPVAESVAALAVGLAGGGDEGARGGRGRYAGRRAGDERGADRRGGRGRWTAARGWRSWSTWAAPC